MASSCFGGGNESRGDGHGGAAGVAGLRRALAAQRARFAGPDGSGDDDDDINNREVDEGSNAIVVLERLMWNSDDPVSELDLRNNELEETDL